MADAQKSLDAILPKIGGFGKFQWYMYSLCAFTAMLNGVVYLSYTFTARIVDHRCKIEDCESSPPQYKDDWVKMAIPKKGNKFEQCKKYVHLGGECNNISSWDTNNTETCSGEDNFVYGDQTRTVMHQFNFQCAKNARFLAQVGLMQNAGQLVGLSSYGYVADQFGRRTTLVVGCLLSSVTAVMKLFYSNYYYFLTLEFLDCVVGRGSYILAEIVPTEWRSMVGNSMGVVAAVGQVLLAWTDYGLRDWRWTTLATHAPNFLVISYFFLMPESIRWQLVKGKIDKVKEALRKIAKFNGKEISEEDLDTLDQLKAQSSGVLSKFMLKPALKSKILMIRLFLYCYLFMAKNYLYYGLTVNSVYLSPEKYRNFTFVALVDIPGYFLTGYVCQRFGRKKVMTLCFAASAIPHVILIFVEKYNSDAANTTLWLLGKFASTMIGGVLYVWCTELFPTYLRQTFIGFANSIGRVGAMVAPYHPVLAHWYEPLPFILYASVSALSAVVCLLSFPETKNKKLPDTVKEAENIKDLPTIQTKF